MYISSRFRLFACVKVAKVAFNQRDRDGGGGGRLGNVAGVARESERAE